MVTEPVRGRSGILNQDFSQASRLRKLEVLGERFGALPCLLVGLQLGPETS